MSPRRALATWLIVFAVATAVAAGTTTKTMGVWPTVAGTIALALTTLGIVAFTVAEGRLGRAAGVVAGLLLLGMGAVAAQEAWKPGWVRGHDVRYHAWAIWSLWRCVLDGDWWPRWNPYLALGLPLLQFYAPLPYVLAWPAQALGLPPDRALGFVLVLTQVLSAATSYASVRWLGGGRGAGLVAGLSLCLLPYHLLDQNLRLALGETVAIPILPLLLTALWKVLRGDPGRARSVLIVTSGLLILTHVLTALTVAVAAVPLTILALTRSEHRWSRLVPVLVAGVMAVRLTAWWWLPMAAEARETALDQIVPANRSMAGWAAEADEWVERTLWPRYGIRYDRTEREDPGEHGMPLYVGNAWLALLVLAVLRPRHGVGPDPRPFAVAAFATLLLATWPFAYLLDGTYVLSRIQFPWRLYSPLGSLLAIAAGLAVERWKQVAPQPVLVGLAVTAMAADSWPFLGSPERMRAGDRPGLSYLRGREVAVLDLDPGPFVRVEEATFPPGDYDHRVALSRLAFPEYMRPDLRRRYGRRRDVPSREESESFGVSLRVGEDGQPPQAFDPAPLATLDGAPLTVMVEPESLTVELPEDHGAGRVALLFSWFPGWEVSVDDAPFRAADQWQDLLVADVPAEARRLQFRYSALRPWDRSLGLAVSLLTVVEVLARRLLSVRRGGRSPSRAPSQPGSPGTPSFGG